MKNYVLTFAILLFSTTILFAKTITVTSGADNGAGTLRQAIVDADNGDEIVFAENVTTVTLTNYGFTLEKSITITGNEENSTAVTCNGRHFYMPENAGVTVCFNNLTLKDGYATQCGGAIFNRKGNTLILNNCRFINNSAGSICGAIDNAHKLTINNCIFENNTSPDGVGAICNTSGGEVFINNSTFTNNKSTVGAICNYPNSSITITGCIFRENEGTVASAFWNRGTATVVNSLFILNEHFSSTTRYDRSGAISNYGVIESEREGISLTLINSIIADNKIDDEGLYNDANATLYNNIIWNNGNGVNDLYTSVNGITTAEYNLIGTSNIALSENGNLIGTDKDPLFDSDYNLQAGSPAINAGNNTYLSFEMTSDLSGKLRLVGSAVDMGAYEFQQLTSAVPNMLSEDVKIYVRYRNNIVVENADGEVSVYDISGRCLSSGKSIINVPTGLYIVRAGTVVERIVVW